jgi:hypothetical protein
MFQNWIEPNLEQEEGSTEVVLIGNIESGWL